MLIRKGSDLPSPPHGMPHPGRGLVRPPSVTRELREPGERAGRGRGGAVGGLGAGAWYGWAAGGLVESGPALCIAFQRGPTRSVYTRSEVASADQLYQLRGNIQADHSRLTRECKMAVSGNRLALAFSAHGQPHTCKHPIWERKSIEDGVVNEHRWS